MAGVQGQTLKPIGVQGQKPISTNQEVDEDFWGPTIGSVAGGTLGAIGGFFVGGPAGAYAGGVAGSGLGASAGKAIEDYYFDDQTPTDVVKTGVIDAGTTAVLSPVLGKVGKIASKFGVNPVDIITDTLVKQFDDVAAKFGSKSDVLTKQVKKLSDKIDVENATIEDLREVSNLLNDLVIKNETALPEVTDLLIRNGLKPDDLTSNQVVQLLQSDVLGTVSKQSLNETIQEDDALKALFTKAKAKPNKPVETKNTFNDTHSGLQSKTLNEIKDVETVKSGLLGEVDAAGKLLTSANRKKTGYTIAKNVAAGGPRGFGLGSVGAIPAATAGATSTIRQVNEGSVSTKTNAEIEAYLIKTYGKEQAAKIMQQKAQRGGNLIQAGQGLNKGGKALSNKVGLLRREGYPQDQAVAIAHSYRKRGMLK